MQWAGTRRNMLLLVVLPALVQGSQLQLGMRAGMMLRYNLSDSESQLRKLEDAAATLNWVSKLEALEVSLQQNIENWCNQVSSTMARDLAQAKRLLIDKQAATEEQKWNDGVREICKHQKQSFAQIVEKDLPQLHQDAVQESQKLQTRLRGAHQHTQYDVDETNTEGKKKHIQEQDTIEVTDDWAKNTASDKDDDAEWADDDEYSDKEGVAAAEDSPQQAHTMKEQTELEPNDSDAKGSRSSEEFADHDDSDPKLVHSSLEYSDHDESDATQVQSFEGDSERASAFTGASPRDEEEDSTETEAAQLKLLTDQAYLQLQSSGVKPDDHSGNPRPIDFVQLGMEINIFQPKQAKQLCKFFDKAKNNTTDSRWLKPLNQAEREMKEATTALVEAKEVRDRAQQEVKECQDMVKIWDADIAQIKVVIEKVSDATTLIQESTQDVNSDSKKIQDDILKQNQQILSGLQAAYHVRHQGRQAQEHRAKILSSRSDEVEKTIQLREAASDRASDKLKQVHKQVDNILETCKRMREEGLASLLVKGIRH